MKEAEIWQILLAAIGVVIQLFGLVYVVVNLNLVRRQFILSEIVHESTLRWNKKVAAETELEKRSNVSVVKKINRTFDQKLQILPLTTITEAIKVDPSIAGNISHILNKYERLARGVLNDYYDETVVRIAIKTPLMRNFMRYSEYITYVQVTNKAAWVQYEKLVTKWMIDENYAMVDSIKNHFQRANKFDHYEISSEDNTWFLFNYKDSIKAKEALFVETGEGIVSIEGLVEKLIILGDDHYGNLLVAFNEAESSETYSFNIKSMELNKTEMFVGDLIP